MPYLVVMRKVRLTSVCWKHDKNRHSVISCLSGESLNQALKAWSLISWRKTKKSVRKWMKKGMKAKEKTCEGEDWELWRVLSQMKWERGWVIHSRTMLRVFSRWGQYWKCILYKYFANVARLCPVTMTGAWHALSSVTAEWKLGKLAFLLSLKAANLKWSSCSQWNLWLWD